MVNAESTKELLAKIGKVGAQPLSDWKGNIELHPAVVQFYEEVGPLNVKIKMPGNPIVLPSLSALWKAQQGYGFDLKGKPLEGWNPAWLVVADASGEALVFDAVTERVLFVLPGEEEWEATPLFESLNAMGAGLATLGVHLKQKLGASEMAKALQNLLGDGPATSEQILVELGLD